MSQVSQACTAGHHGMCPESRETCTCQVCHHRCERCLQETTNLYNAENEQQICASCYKLDILASEGRSRCETCGAGFAYRDPREDSRFLCTDCHRLAGHRYQTGGRWVENVKGI